MITVPEINAPVIRYDGDKYELVNAVVDYEFDDADTDVLQSVLNGDREIVEHGEHFSGVIDYKPNDLSTYNALKAMQGKVVRLWMFGDNDGTAIVTGEYYPYCDVIITVVKPYHRSKLLYLDAMMIQFVSEKVYTLARAADKGWIDEPET